MLCYEWTCFAPNTFTQVCESTGVLFLFSEWERLHDNGSFYSTPIFCLLGDEAKFRTYVISLSVLQAFYEIKKCKVKVAFMLITYYFSGQDGSFPSSHIVLQFLQTASKRTSLSFCHSAGVSLWNNAFLWSLASVSAKTILLQDTVTRKCKRSLYLTQLATSSRTSWVRRTVSAVADWKAWVCGALAKAVVYLYCSVLRVNHGERAKPLEGEQPCSVFMLIELPT